MRKRLALAALSLLIVVEPLFARVQKDVYSLPCSILWPAVKDTVRNSGYYAVVMIDNTEMIASFAIGAGQDMRIDSAVLNEKGDTCVMQVQPLYEGSFSNDAADFKKRVDKSLAQLQRSQLATPAKP